MTPKYDSRLRIPSLLETQRLVLRMPRIEDAYALRDLAASDAAFSDATIGGGRACALEDACTAIVRMQRDHGKGIGTWRLVELKADQRLVGITGFSSRHPGSPQTALATEALGNGFASELIEALVLGSGPHPMQQAAVAKAESGEDKRDPTHPTRWCWEIRRSTAGTLRCA